MLEPEISHVHINVYKQTNHQAIMVVWWYFDNSRWQPFAIIHLFSTLLDHLRYILGSVYFHAKIWSESMQ